MRQPVRPRTPDNSIEGITLEVLLASSLIRASRRVDSPNWVGSVFKATLVPFVIVMILTVAVAWISAHYCPGASKLTDVFRSLWHGG